MAGTVLIRRLTGAGPTATDVTSINSRLSTADSHSTASTSNPIQIPTAGSNYSYWASFRLDCTVAPPTSISNLRYYTDGANSLGTGVSLNVAKASTGAASGYRVATGTGGTTGDLLNQTNHTGLDEAPANAFTFTSGSPKSLTGSTSGTGQFGDILVAQIAVGTTASDGPTAAQETMSYVYDEI